MVMRMLNSRAASACWHTARSCAASRATSSSSASTAALQPGDQRPLPFHDFVQTARSDVVGLLGQVEGASWVERLHRLSQLALDLWQPESPHWRVAGPLVVPSALSNSRQFPQELAAALSAQKPLGPEARATVLRALCALKGGEAATRRNIMVLLATLVDSRGVVGAHRRDGGLALQLPLEELRKCICSISESSIAREEAQKESAVRDFTIEGAKRLSKAPESVGLPELLALDSALRLLEVDRKEVEAELRRRLLEAAGRRPAPAESRRRPGASQGSAKLSEQRQIVSLIAGSQVLGEVAVLRAPHIREALLPDTLSTGDAAELLRHALPADGALNSAHEMVVAQASRQVVMGARTLSPRQIASAVRGVLALQARGDEFAVGQAAKILRALWSRVALRQAFFGPKELSDILWAYWWQLLYSRQELALAGTMRMHPVVPPGDGSSRNTAKETKAMDDLSAKLLRPTIGRLAEMPLKQVSACLTALAPPVRQPDVMSEADRILLVESVHNVFSLSDVMSSQPFPERWMQEYWSSELLSLTVPELLELACGMREARMDSRAWPLKSVVAEVDERLRAFGKTRPPVELSHFLLLRLCRVMDLWHGHEVEEVLKSLLSDPEAVKPLPTAYFVALLSALCEFAVPKELPLRLVSSFLDRVDRNEHVVRPEQWAEILRAVRPLDEWPSYERVTPRLIQRLVPHLEGLQPPVLAATLVALAAKPFTRETHALGSAATHSPLTRVPAAALEAVRKVVAARSLDFLQVVTLFESLGKLGWYSEPTTAAVLNFLAETPLLEPHAPSMLPLVRACASLRVHHAPLLHKVVLWYCWCFAYLWAKPLPSEKLDELLELAEYLMELSFQSLELQGVLAENLKNPNATSRQTLALLSALARCSHFPAEFKDTCAKTCSTSSDSDLASLTTAELVNSFNVHLCAVFDGPAALKHWLTEDEGMKSFFQVHTSQKWYQKQDQERTTFLQSPAYLSLKQAITTAGLDLQPSAPGEVYHMEFVSSDAKERLSSLSDNPPTAVVCVKTKEQLRWYVPITADDSSSQVLETHNRCHQFRFMFREAVQKMRHLQAMGYRPAVIWMSEWNTLSSEEERVAYLRTALGEPASFRPASAEEEDIYR